MYLRTFPKLSVLHAVSGTLHCIFSVIVLYVYLSSTLRYALHSEKLFSKVCYFSGTKFNAELASSLVHTVSLSASLAPTANKYPEQGYLED